jgi:hypothetical protein
MVEHQAQQAPRPKKRERPACDLVAELYIPEFALKITLEKTASCALA